MTEPEERSESVQQQAVEIVGRDRGLPWDAFDDSEWQMVEAIADALLPTVDRMIRQAQAETDTCTTCADCARCYGQRARAALRADLPSESDSDA